MPVFISYSHADASFAEHLAKQLVAQKANVWLDKWELSVGDSLLERIQSAVQGSSALLVVLSKASVASEWCKKELNSGLLRELEEKRVVVMPVLLEDCEIPIFIRGKLYADFRSNFDQGLQTLLQGIAKVTSTSLGRVDNPEFHLDWALDWSTQSDDALALRLTLVEQAIGQRFSCLTTITIISNEEGLRRYHATRKKKSGDHARFEVIELLANAVKDGQEIRPRLSDQFEQTMSFPLLDPTSDSGYLVTVSARRLGEDTGRDILLNIEGQLEIIRNGLKRTLRNL
jgi:hypothetical protein